MAIAWKETLIFLEQYEKAALASPDFWMNWLTLDRSGIGEKFDTPEQPIGAVVRNTKELQPEWFYRMRRLGKLT